MPQFRKKPVVIDAFQMTPERYDDRGGWPDWLREAPNVRRGAAEGKGVVAISTSEGVMVAQPNDWIIRGVKGELYPCKPDIFAATYDPVDEVSGG